jgi:tetratricopeptide (TPR) repeat protein
MAAAQNLLSWARNLLPSGHPLRLTVTQRLAEFLLSLGRFNEAQDMLIELAAAANGDRSAELSARLEHARIQHVIGPDPVPLDTIRRQADVAEEYFAQVGDYAGQQRASFLLGCVHERAGRLIASEQAFRRSLAHADRSGDTRERLACRWMLVEALALGRTPVDACIAECRELTASLGLDYPVLCWQAVLEALRLRFDAARTLAERARQAFAEQGRMLMFVADAAASIALLAGDSVAAERELRSVWAFARDTAEPEHLAPSTAKLARVLIGQGRLEEAAEFASLSAEHAPREGAEGQALSRAALARVASARAEHMRAVDLAQAPPRHPTRCQTCGPMSSSIWRRCCTSTAVTQKPPKRPTKRVRSTRPRATSLPSVGRKPAELASRAPCARRILQKAARLVPRPPAHR